MKKLLTFAPTMAILAACNGSTGGMPTLSAPPPAPGAPSYETIASTAPVTSQIGGVAYRVLPDLSLVPVSSSGTYRHDTRSFSLTIDGYAFSDPDGFDQNLVATDGSAIFEATGEPYEYVDYLTASIPDGNGGTNYYIMMTGVITDASDVPTSAMANYTGIAYGFYATPNNVWQPSSRGTAAVTADFGGGRVDATLTLEPNILPYDTVIANNMSISGNTFGGGTVQFESNGSVVTPTGANSTTNSQGAFFGFDAATGVPDEVAGQIAVSGDNGTVYADYIGD